MRKTLRTAVATAVAAGTLAATAGAAFAHDGRGSKQRKPAPAPTATIAGLVAASGGDFDHNHRDYDMLLNAVKAAGLVDALNDAGADLTVFAPNDRAFVRLARTLGYHGTDEAGAFDAIVGVLTKLGNGDPIPVLKQVLLYHVVSGTITARDARGADSVTTLQGGSLGVEFPKLIDADPDLRDARVIRPFDLRATNGIVHTIDRVLLPLDV
ncbi:MAG: fasciclin domain-containing protein [Acidimicrobiia bacterium]